MHSPRLVPPPVPEKSSFRLTLFVLAFLLAAGAAVTMTVHAWHARDSRHENALTPGILALVQVLKIPKLHEKYQRHDDWVNWFLLWGSVIALCLWLGAFGIAL